MLFVNQSKSEYTIVLSDVSSESTLLVAKKLRDYVQASTGAILEITTTAKQPFISIGKTEAYVKEGYSVTEEELNGDGFKILFSKGNIYLCAANERGLVYAVNDFVERYLDVAFLTAEETVVPKKERIDIKEKDIVEIPSFKLRSFFASTIMQNAEFAAKMRMVSPYMDKDETDKYGGGFLSDWNSNEMHSMQTFIPKEKYYDKHPEWYANDRIRAWLCLTNGLTDDDEDDENPDSLLSTIANRIIEEVKNCPTQKYFMLGHEDSQNYCECERCKRSREKHGTISGYLMVWINAIARRVEKWRIENCPAREVNLVSFSYLDTIVPPVFIVDENGERNKPIEYLEREYWAPLRVREGKIVPASLKVVPEKNVVIYCAILSTCYMHEMGKGECDWNKYCDFSLKGWRELGARIMIWYYGVNFSHHLWWLPNRKTLATHLTHFKKYEPLFVQNQGAPREDGFYQTNLNTYLLSKLMWNTSLDVDVLTKNFNKLYFGQEVAEYVNRFIEKIENHYAELDEKYDGLYHSDIGENFPMSFAAENFPLPFLIDLIQDLEKALNIAKDEKTKVKVKSVLVQPLYMLVYNFNAYKNVNEKYFEKLESYVRDCGIKNFSEGKSAEEVLNVLRKRNKSQN